MLSRTCILLPVRISDGKGRADNLWIPLVLVSSSLTELRLLTIIELNGRVRKEGREEEARQIDELVGSAYDEAKLGAGVTAPRVVCVARKRPVPYAVRVWFVGDKQVTVYYNR
jgi:hypothetical protein